ncbi:metallophosphoesterase [Variovorax sp. J31P179]|uniref:metallophosphoesterase n=1 Tax=Variovorax sp. J31P179 TaxID=3053508 RepID=UPI002577C6AE|nr:metallophosphoesterase [Variovorax sp. J31P179]MDM0085659.1 metallophosphoesterase [Variovorax sp. J31P179]
MRLLILSDLHLEFGHPFVPPTDGYDVAIIAGDIAVPAASASHWAKRASTFPCAKGVIYVLGNHEFYGGVVQSVASEMNQAARDSKVHALDCSEVVIYDVRFLGCTLWTDFALRIDSHIGPYSHVPRSLGTSRRRLSDYRVIRTEMSAQELVGATGRYLLDPGGERDHRLLTPEDTLAFHRAQRQWLATKLAEPFVGPTVVVTHHAPHRQSLAARYADDWCSGAFVSELPEEFFKVPVLWVHGHTHTSFDYRVGNCRVLSNPRGYLSASQPPENEQFDPALVVDV